MFTDLFICGGVVGIVTDSTSLHFVFLLAGGEGPLEPCDPRGQL